jgi:D-cysteine desulfhydrase
MLAAVARAHWIGWRRRGFVVPLGASTPTATLGYVNAALELIEQVHSGQLPELQEIFLPFATGGSVAGLIVGLGLAGAGTRVVAVQAVESLIANRRRLEKLVESTLDLLGAGKPQFDNCLRRLDLIDDRQLGRGYRDKSKLVETAVATALHCGLHLETAFSGKAFASMLGALEESAHGSLLFWNTHDQRHETKVKGDA